MIWNKDCDRSIGSLADRYYYAQVLSSSLSITPKRAMGSTVLFEGTKVH